MNYKEMVNKAYNKYIKDWCGARGYTPSCVDPETGINGECYVCINEFERNEFQDEGYMRSILSDSDFVLWKDRASFKDVYLRSVLSRIHFNQTIGKIERCPRYGKPMAPKLSYNSLSRRATVYICAPCGTMEALEDAPFAELAKTPIEDWEFAQNVSYDID